MTQRRGFTLVEVLIALVILGIVTGAIYRMLNTSQRLAVAHAERVNLQSNVRTGSLVVPNELRELNTVQGAGAGPQNDVIDADADGITYRAMRGLGFVCQVPAGNEVRILASTWTGLRVPNKDRDSLYLFVDGNTDEDDDDSWLQMDITLVTYDAAACAGAPGYKLSVAAPPAVPVNTPVRLFEVMRLELYANGGQWWLGARSESANEVNQPMLGPLTNNGFALQYLNAAGAVTADLTAIKSIRLTVRGLTDGAVRLGDGPTMGHPEEALVTQVLLRNSIRP